MDQLDHFGDYLADNFGDIVLVPTGTKGQEISKANQSSNLHSKYLPKTNKITTKQICRNLERISFLFWKI